MIRPLIATGLLLQMLLTGGCYLGEPYVDGPPHARVATSLGEFVIELIPDLAPVTVENFQQYALEGFYDGTTFHRVVPGFVIQGGGFLPDMQQKPTRDPIGLESRTGLRNFRSTVAMARTAAPDSATSQFFVNLVDNPVLDATLDNAGYAVFGVVVEGMDVVDAIAAVATQTVGEFDDVPVEPVVILSVTIEASEPTLSPSWEAYGQSIEVNTQAYIRNTAIGVFNLFLAQ